jgi:8-oxo-dGTP diphosphatase
MENNNINFAVFIYVFNKNYSKILLIKRNQEKRNIWGFDWGTLGGKGRNGETCKEAIIREAKEESGLNFENPKFCFFKESINKDKESHSIHFFFSETIDENENLILSEESDEYDWFELNNLPEKMVDSKEHILDIVCKSSVILK